MQTWKTNNGYLITRLLAGRSNVFLLSNGSRHILIDTCIGLMRRKLRRRLQKAGVDQVDLLVITHAHFDHANNALMVRDKFKAKVIVHEAEAEILATGGVVMISGSNPVLKALVRLAMSTVSSLTGCNPCPYDLVVTGSYDLSAWGFNAKIIHTPGHSGGSVSVIVDDEIAIVGDTLFGIFPWTVFPPFLQDEVQLIESWGKLLDTGCKLFLPAHGSAISRKRLEKGYGSKIGIRSEINN
ncbi:MAG TPA: MBL fold metallo-hydrolase [Bacteroidales bacterium]|nr:MBL fold metallo-hydrolase [Bacteroidales bacterium]